MARERSGVILQKTPASAQSVLQKRPHTPLVTTRRSPLSSPPSRESRLGMVLRSSRPPEEPPPCARALRRPAHADRSQAAPRWATATRLSFNCTPTPRSITRLLRAGPRDPPPPRLPRPGSTSPATTPCRRLPGHAQSCVACFSAACFSARVAPSVCNA